MPTSRVLTFRDLDTRSRADVALSVSRSIQQLPLLGESNPDAALVIGRTIDAWMPPPSDGGDQRSLPPMAAAMPARAARLTRLPRATPVKWISEELAYVEAELRKHKRSWIRRA